MKIGESFKVGTLKLFGSARARKGWIVRAEMFGGDSGECFHLNLVL